MLLKSVIVRAIVEWSLSGMYDTTSIEALDKDHAKPLVSVKCISCKSIYGSEWISYVYHSNQPAAFTQGNWSLLSNVMWHEKQTCERDIEVALVEYCIQCFVSSDWIVVAAGNVPFAIWGFL